MHTLIAWSLVALAAAVLSTAPAHAQSPRGPALNWVRLPGAEACIAPVELAHRVETRLGRAVFVRANDALVVVEGRVGPNSGGGFSAVIQVSDPDGTLYGTRELASPDADCRALDDVVALVIAVTLRRGAGGSGIELPPSIAAELDRLFAADSAELDPDSLPPPAASENVVPPAAVAPNAPVPVTTSEGNGGSVHVDFDLGLAAASGIQPGATLGPRLRLRLGGEAIGSAGLEAGFGGSSEEAIGGDEVGAMEYATVYGGLTLCAPEWRRGVLALGACLAGRLGNLHVEPRGFAASSHTSDELWLDAGPELSAAVFAFETAYLQLSIGLPIRILAPEIAYIDSRRARATAFSVARVGVLAGLGLGIRL